MPDAATSSSAHRVGRTSLTLEVVYVASVTALATIGMSTEHLRRVLLLATLVALPLGLAALVGLYVLTAFFNAAASGFSSSSVTSESGGCDPTGHCWSHVTGTPVGARGFLFSALVVACFMAAALGNILVLRAVIRARHR
jgi:hypothetical protein